MAIAGIILAAGASSRMGSPKALLDYRGETFIARLARVLSGACSPVIVVLGYHAEAIRSVIPDHATIVPYGRFRCGGDGIDEREKALAVSLPVAVHHAAVAAGFGIE